MAYNRKVEIKSTAEAIASIRADYNAAKTSRLRRRRTGLASMGSSADWHYRSEADYLKLIEMARDMDRNDVFMGQLVDRAVFNTVQGGIGLDVRTGDKYLDRDLGARWKAWADSTDECDISGEMTFNDMESLILRSVFVDGDVLVLPNKSGSLQLVEAHRLRTPKNTTKNVVHGILLDELRRRLEYWLTKDDIDPLRIVYKVNEIQAYTARDAKGDKQVLHIYNPKRITQTRGVTAFAPIFDTASQFEDINFAKLLQQQIVSCVTFFRERESSIDIDSTHDAYGESESQTMGDGSTRILEGIAPGMEISGLPGEKLHGFSPNVPNPEFFEHARMTLQLMSLNLGLPVVIALLDARETNFSGWRGALDQAKLGFQRNQQWLVSKFHRPVYKWKVRQWIAEDPALRAAFESGKDVLGHRWNPPNWPYIEPLKDANADNIRLTKNLTSPRRLHAERGRDYDDVVEEIIQDRETLIVTAIKRAEKIKKKFPGAEVDWRELAYGADGKPQAPPQAAPEKKQPTPAKKGATENA